MTTGNPYADFAIAGFALAWLLFGAYAARQWIVKHFGRAKKLPSGLPERDEASASEFGTVFCPACAQRWEECVCPNLLGKLSEPARMQGNSAARGS